MPLGVLPPKPSSPLSEPTKTKPRTATPHKSGDNKPHVLRTLTLRSPPFSYIHLSLLPTTACPPSFLNSSASQPNCPPTVALEPILLRRYLTTALQQSLGDTGAGIPLDILSCELSDCWVRVPRPDRADFAAAVTAFGGMQVDDDEGGNFLVQLRIRTCGDWLGAIVGREEEEALWRG